MSLLPVFNRLSWKRWRGLGAKGENEMKRPTGRRKRVNGAHSSTAATAPKRKASARPRLEIAVLVGTRKCALIYLGDSSRRRWRVDGPHFLGHIIDHLVLDPRDHRTLLAAARTGHLGPTIFRSLDMGRTWTEATRPPMFGRPPEGMAERAVDHTCSLTPALPGEPGV